MLIHKRLSSSHFEILLPLPVFIYVLCVYLLFFYLGYINTSLAYKPRNSEARDHKEKTLEKLDKAEEARGEYLMARELKKEEVSNE